MIVIRKILFPFSVLYGCITQFRNFLYDNHIFKSHTFKEAVIVVGNLSVGGTGKTPQIEYLIRLLSEHYKVATLSRGYKRQTKGYILADSLATASSIGDEPYQYYKKFPNIQVAVDADRKNGISRLLSQISKPEVLLLDDAFQHRKVKAGFYILLTTYKELFCDDFLLPSGNLREGRSGAKRANVIVVTKCPESCSFMEQELIKKKINLDIPIFFSTIVYDDFIYSEQDAIKVSAIKTVEKLLLTGIANPTAFYNYLQSEKNTVLTFPDHHFFTDADILKIKNKANNTLIITTEKDYVRLKNKISEKQLYYLPIKTAFLEDEINFKKTIFYYVEKSTGIS